MGPFARSTDKRAPMWRTRWSAIGAAVAVTLGGGGMFAAHAASSAESSSVLIDPVRILDTRDPLNVGLAGPFVSAGSVKLQVTGAVPTTGGTATPVPAGATGVILNVTAVNAAANGFISIRPGDAAGAPATSSLNVTAGVTVPNAVTVALPTAGANAGQIDITWDALGTAGPTTDILIDVVGYATTSKLSSLQAAVDALRIETVAFSGLDMTGLGAFQLGTSNACAVNLDARESYLTIPIPTGATILSASALIYDYNGLTTYTAELRRYSSNGLGDARTVLSTATGGELAIKSVTEDLTPTVPETADPGERFVVHFDDGLDSFGNGLCGVTVTYQLAAGGAPLTASLRPSDPGSPPVCDDPTVCHFETP